MTQMCLSSISNEPEKLRQSLPHVFLRLQTGTIYPTRRCSSLTYSALKRSFWNAVCEKGYNNPSALQSCRCPLPRWQAGADDGQTPSPHSADHTEAHLLPFIRLAASVHLAQTQKTGIINTSRVGRITHWQGLPPPRVSARFCGQPCPKETYRVYTPCCPGLSIPLSSPGRCKPHRKAVPAIPLLPHDPEQQPFCAVSW